MGIDLAVLQGQLEAWADAHYHEGITVAGLEVMPGHAGLSFGFRLEHTGAVVDDLVMRMPPSGVRRSGNTDVLRQVPLLQALAMAGVPVPPVRWWDEDERWFGVPYTMVDRLPGDTYQVRAPGPQWAGTGVTTADVLTAAVRVLATVHRVDWTERLSSWEDEKDLRAEVLFWDPLLAKSAQPEWIGMGERTRELLLAQVPEQPTVGIFHGDFQTNNVLFRPSDGDGVEVVAVLDWEISGIGAQLLDLGWLLMMNDPDSWADGVGLTGVPPFADLVAAYAAASGRSVTLDDVAWYRALSGYRFGVISCFNVMLHRTGKRVDPEWERIAPSVPHLFGRAADLLGRV